MKLELSPLNIGNKFTWSVHAGSRLQTIRIAGHQPVTAVGSARTLPLLAESWWVMILMPVILYNQKSICCVELVLGECWYPQHTRQCLTIVLPLWQQLVVLQPHWWPSKRKGSWDWFKIHLNSSYLQSLNRAPMHEEQIAPIITFIF